MNCRNALVSIALLVFLLPFAHAATGDSVQISVSFPPEANKTSIDATLPLGDCQSAQWCFSRKVLLNCRNYEAKGMLACAGHSEIEFNCLITAVDDFSGPGWFGFYVNGQLADTGVSCYVPKAGDVLELRYSNNADSEVSTPTPTPTPALTATPVPTPTPIITPYPGLVYDANVSTPSATPVSTQAATNATPTPTASAGSSLTGEFVMVIPSPIMQGAAIFILGAIVGGAFVYTRKRR